jgi:hypothetical protein
MIAPIRQSYRPAPWRRQQWALARLAVARALLAGPPISVRRNWTLQALLWMGVTCAFVLTAFAGGFCAWLAIGPAL